MLPRSQGAPMTPRKPERTRRLQVFLSADEIAAIDDFRLKLLAEPCPSIRSHYRGRHEIGKIMLRLLGREGINPQTVSAGKFAAGR
jgi:hypothetical protein